MNEVYLFVRGPLCWAAVAIFVIGSLYRLISLLALVQKKEKFIFSYMSLRYSLRSIFHWLTPFATVNMRMHPAMTIVTFAFHLCLFLTPLFLLAHIVLIGESWNLSWWSLPDGLADFMTLVVIGGCIFFLFRRRIRPEVKFLTSTSDYILLAMVAAPFITGFFAFHQWFGYQSFLILHIFTGELVLAAIPFTRLSHMLFSPLTRAYAGSEFGKIRNARDW